MISRDRQPKEFIIVNGGFIDIHIYKLGCPVRLCEGLFSDRYKQTDAGIEKPAKQLEYAYGNDRCGTG